MRGTWHHRTASRRSQESETTEGSGESFGGDAGAATTTTAGSNSRQSRLARLRNSLRGQRSASLSQIDAGDRRRWEEQATTPSRLRPFRRPRGDDEEEGAVVENLAAVADAPLPYEDLFPTDPPSLVDMDHTDEDESSHHYRDSLLHTRRRHRIGEEQDDEEDEEDDSTGDGYNTPVTTRRVPTLASASISPPFRNSLTMDAPYYRQSSITGATGGSLYTRALYTATPREESPAFPPEEDEYVEFYPPISHDHEWMGRSVESLILGHAAPAPILALHESLDEETEWWDCTSYRRRSTASTFGGDLRRSSQGSFPGGRRGSLSLSGNFQGGTLASYNQSRRRALQQQSGTDYDRSYISFDRRRASISSSNQPMNRRRSSTASSVVSLETQQQLAQHQQQQQYNHQQQPRAGTDGGNRNRRLGPSVVLSIMARESTGKSCFTRGMNTTQALRTMGGAALFAKLDQPAAGMGTEVAFLAAAIDAGDWTETQTIVSRISPRLIGDPMAAAAAAAAHQADGSHRPERVHDANLPPTAPRYYAGGGRLGLERDAFVLAGGAQVLIRLFREKSFVGQEMALSNDARDLSEEILTKRLANCWNETLVVLRELVFSIPSLVENETILDEGEFLPFLFTLLAHDSCFDAAAALIEESISLMSQAAPQSNPASDATRNDDGSGFVPSGGRSFPATTFFLGDIPDLYKLWNGFNCRQLAHFSRILALLVFEPEDRQLWESSTALKSLELLHLRRNRAVRAGRDSTVDMNQSILLGDDVLIRRLLQLLKVMNFAPSIRRFSPYHVMSHFPFIADTLVIMGLDEIVSWDEVDRQDKLARQLLRVSADEEPPLLHELGRVTGMLENLSESLGNNASRESATQIGQILQVLSAAQDAGVVVGRNGSDRHSTRNTRNSEDTSDVDAGSAQAQEGESAPERASSFASMFASQLLMRQLYETTGVDMGVTDHIVAPANHTISAPEDAANSLQFNGMLLAPCQVEILFVLCTLLGGRRKLDAQSSLNRLGVIEVLDDMFQRLPWYKEEASGEESNPEERARGPGDNPDQVTGIHGPGCDCTPESPLCVQYLRLLHNFCDRDCDNYLGRRLMLSESEQRFIFSPDEESGERVKPGLLLKIVKAFINESDESPYRFWLASCIESYLRGSSSVEQVYVARSGLLQHLLEDVSSERLHCAGSLQTSFDLLGELGKGNAQIFRMLVNDLDEAKFRKLMGVAATNLVDSNVFIRSLLLSLERLSATNQQIPLFWDTEGIESDRGSWHSLSGRASQSYLTHSWWDMHPRSISSGQPSDESSIPAGQQDENRPSDWFPSRQISLSENFFSHESAVVPSGSDESVGYFGWLFSPAGDNLSDAAFLPNTTERLSWFLAANQARLLRDLLGVVDLRNINHENICCLNTAVVVVIFAHRRQQLSTLLDDLRRMNDDEKEVKRRAQARTTQDDIVDRGFVQSMRYLELDQQQEGPSYATGISSTSPNPEQQIGDRTDVMRNFREVLWFWMEYYTHRGRDRLSLEFSSRIRFQEWNQVVSLLAADEASTTALVNRPVRLPRSPYRRGL
jgi:hypothetical protein